MNELMPFLEFVEHHPIGTSVNGTVDSYSSHGAYIIIGDSDVRGYVPLRLMADPAPRSAKSVMKVGESVTVVVVSFAPTRRSIDCAVPDQAASAIAEAGAELVDGEPTPTALPRSATKRPAAKKEAVGYCGAPQVGPCLGGSSWRKRRQRKKKKKRRRMMRNWMTTAMQFLHHAQSRR